ncbi:MAG: hypothetical protein ACJ749_00375 [Flavisolibacter sp.]|jgi:hypothetical protein
MATLNKLSDLSTIGNTGVGGLFFDPKIIVGAFLCPKGFELDISSIQANLVAATHNSTKRSRIYPIYDFLSPKDATEDKIMQQFNTGAKKPVREGYNDWSFQFVQGGVDLLQSLRNFNGSLWDFIFVDSLNRLIGITGSSATKLRAVPSDGGFFWANPWKSNDGTKVTEYMVQFVFNVKYLNSQLAFAEAGFDVQTTINGLQDVNITAVDGGTPGTYKISAKTKVGLNLADLYPTILAGGSAPAKWTAKNATSGADCTITSIAIGTDTNGDACFVFVMLTSDTDYSGATNIKFDLTSPATLQAAGVDGYESTGAATVAKN